MSITGLREDSLAGAVDAFGVDVTVLAVGPFTEEKIVQGIWVQPVTATDLGGFDVQSDRPSRILALRRSDVQGINREARVRAGDGVGGRVRVFRVDAPVEIFSDHLRLSLVPDDASTAPASGTSRKKEAPDRKPQTDDSKTGPSHHDLKHE